MRLVALVDAVLDAGAERSPPFLLDGQAIVLEDYLVMRPDREPVLRAALSSGAVEGGPWYVLADNLIPSGEAIVRNLEAGRRVLDRLGASAPPVLYCPDSFGHPARLPSVAAGFGLPVAVVWRGLGGRAHPRGDAMWWHAADGVRVLAYHLPPDGYEYGSALPTDAGMARTRWARMLSLIRARSVLPVVLLPNGADHHALQPDVRAALAMGQEQAARHDVVLHSSSLRAFAEDLSRAAHEAPGALPTVQGELRDSYGYTWTLQGTFAVRAHEKRTNARLERSLLRDVEPWLALARLRHHGRLVADGHTAPTEAGIADGAIGVAQHAALLARAWESLLATHPHDTLCGCSIDAVALAMEQRQRAVASMLPELRESALASLLAHDHVGARAAAPLASPPVVVRNRAARARGGVAEITIVDTIADAAVGPGSASADMATGTATSPALPDGVQLLRSRIRFGRRESPQHYPDNDAVRERRCLSWVPPVPGFGLRVLDPTQLAPPLDAPMPATIERDGHRIVLANGALRVEASRDGVRVVAGDRVIEDALRLVSTVDAGDSYTSSPRGHARPLALRRVRAAAGGPLRASVHLDWTLPGDNSDPVPAELDRFTPASERRASRTRSAPTVRVRTTLSLDAGSAHLRCAVRVDNGMPDHRLQLVWRADVARDATVRADAAFGPVVRDRITAPEGAAETPPPSMPLHRWCSIADDARGIAVISDGLTEAESGERSLAVTLLRATGELSRSDLPERPGHAGWPARVPRAQCRGRYQARLALVLHGAWSEAVTNQLEECCDDVLLPLRGRTWRDLGHGAGVVEGIALHGAGLAASATTLAHDDGAIVLRCVNLLDRAVDGTWSLPDEGPWDVTPVRLDETPVGSATRATRHVAFSAAPREIVTLMVRPTAR